MTTISPLPVMADAPLETFRRVMFAELERWRGEYPTLVVDAVAVRRRSGRDHSQELALLWVGHDRVSRALNELMSLNPRRSVEARSDAENAWKDLDRSTTTFRRRVRGH